MLSLDLGFQIICLVTEAVCVFLKSLKLLFPLTRIQDPHSCQRKAYMVAFMNELDQPAIDPRYLQLEVVTRFDIVH